MGLNTLSFGEDTEPILIASKDVPDVSVGFKDRKEPKEKHIIINLKRPVALSMARHLLSVFKNEL
jgi:hypothetical protein